MVSEPLRLPRDYAPAPGLLAGRVILVTGAGSGIGRAVALALARHGAELVLLGRKPQALESLYEAIESGGGVAPVLHGIDLGGARFEDYAQLAAALEDRYRCLDGLLHNAAELGALCPIEHTEPEQWARVLQVNLHAPFALTRALLPLLRRSPDASLLFTSADVGRRARAYWGAYAVSKFAIEGLAQVLAEELEANTRIRVNTLDPGPTRTRLRASAYPGEDPNALVPPEALTPAYLYLLGPDGARLRGRALHLERAVPAEAKDASRPATEN